MNCHQPMAGSIRGYFDNVAFKSTSIQLAIDDAKEIVRFDPKTLKVTDGDVQEAGRSAARGPQGTRDAHRVRREGRPEVGHRSHPEGTGQGRQGRPRQLRVHPQAGREARRQRRADRLAAAAPLPAGHDPGRDQHSVSGVGQGRGEAAAGRQVQAARVLLPGRDLPDEPAVAAQGDRDGLQEHQGLSRGRARVADEGLPRHAARVRQGGLRRQGHPGDHPRRPLARGSGGWPHQGRGQHAGGQREEPAQDASRRRSCRRRSSSTTDAAAPMRSRRRAS